MQARNRKRTRIFLILDSLCPRFPGNTEDLAQQTQRVLMQDAGLFIVRFEFASALDDVELAPEEVDGATELELDGAAELELTVAAVVLATLLMTVEEAEDNDRSRASER
ncbi:hypothetical protein FIBSPDRAFT_1053417 [Athelia psychrophila]|uniref:Uncharacterized protein n=1 Tax=Athelia psychrophila TaxID=1759441 RepID=A0A167WZ47_9AGAM|nr:hypothetical protein FIBSPDRAFT_1053417 [Fibularhizoctonia sp. CBS 109695]